MKGFFRGVSKVLFVLEFIVGLVCAYKSDSFFAGIIVTIIILAWTGMVLEFFDNVADIRNEIIFISKSISGESTTDKVIVVDPNKSMWTCSHCGNRNLAVSQECSECGKQRPKE